MASAVAVVVAPAFYFQVASVAVVAVAEFYGGSGGGGGNFDVPPFNIPAGDGLPYLDSSVLANSAILVPGGNTSAYGEAAVSSVLEPISLALLGSGFAGLLALRRIGLHRGQQMA